MPFKARIAFTVRHIAYAESINTVLGNVIEWDDLVYVYTTKAKTFSKVRIESATTASGPFNEVASVDWDNGTYTDIDAAQGMWYKVRLEDAKGNLSEYTLPKSTGNPDTVVISGYIKRIDGTPGKAELYFRLFRPPKLTDTKEFIDTLPYLVTTETDGYFQVELVKNVVVTVSSKEAGLDKVEFVVPSDRQFVDLWELI